MARTLVDLTGEKTPAKAWNKIFRHFNAGRGKKGEGHRPGEKIAIKINNNNNTYSHKDSHEINASPQMLFSLLTSLIEEGGVPQEDITVAEPSRFITDYLFNKCHGRFPGVRFVDNCGGEGRVKAEYVPDAMHYSRDNGELARGIATPFTEADYVINMALDMVCVDLLTTQFPDMPDAAYSDMYLLEAARAEKAPSGTVYDPEGDGVPLKSLGVAEHWNNADDRRYSRNLGSGDGIELVYRRR